MNHHKIFTIFCENCFYPFMSLEFEVLTLHSWHHDVMFFVGFGGHYGARTEARR